MPASLELTERRRPAELTSRRILPAAAGNETEFADHYLQIARLLLAYGRTEIARRRLQRVVEKYRNTPAAAESQTLLTALDVSADSGVSDRQVPTEV
jgi:hypothetical protein